MLASYGGACLSEGAAQAPRTPPPPPPPLDMPLWSVQHIARVEKALGQSLNS